jgi:hypothetical protein
MINSKLFIKHEIGLWLVCNATVSHNQKREQHHPSQMDLHPTGEAVFRYDCIRIQLEDARIYFVSDETGEPIHINSALTEGIN